MKNIAKALLEVQKGLDPIHKGRQGYGYKYADLPAVMSACLDSLNNAGVLVVQQPEKTDKAAACVVTRLIHAESGEEIFGTIEVPHGEIAKMSIAQAYGSAMTYARRYALVSMLGIVTEDDDGAGAGKKVPREPAKPEYKSEQVELFRMGLKQASSLPELKDMWSQVAKMKYEKAEDLEKLKDARKLELA